VYKVWVAPKINQKNHKTLQTKPIPVFNDKVILEAYLIVKIPKFITDKTLMLYKNVLFNNNYKYY
tara:strand:- start:20624 stop:20818 length:195 start_codon:yes stop_codon:yes gene_type:complete